MSCKHDPHKAGRAIPAYETATKLLTHLGPGEQLVYHVEDGRPRCPGAFAAAWDAHVKGWVTLLQRRDRRGALVYFAVGLDA